MNGWSVKSLSMLIPYTPIITTPASVVIEVRNRTFDRTGLEEWALNATPHLSYTGARRRCDFHVPSTYTRYYCWRLNPVSREARISTTVVGRASDCHSEMVST